MPLSLPASGYLSNAARTEGEMKTALEDVRDFIAGAIGGAAPSELTIASGAITPTAMQHRIDTEGDAASDDLVTIDQTNIPDGGLFLGRIADNGRNVNVVNGGGGAGQILTGDGADFLLDTTAQWILLQRRGTVWDEVMRSWGGQKSALRTWLGLGSAALLAGTARTGGTLAPTIPVQAAKTDNATLVAGDIGTEVPFNVGTAKNANLTAAATLGSGWNAIVRATGAGTVTIDPNGSETIDGAATLAVASGGWVWIVCDGSNFKSIAAGPVAGGGGGGAVPSGTVIPFGGTAVPTGFLECNGQNVNRTTYADLFTAIGTTWGVGDGSTTFTLPDLRRRAMVGSGGTGTGTLGNAVGDVGGAETHTLTTAEMPAHTHTDNYVFAGGAANIVSSGGSTYGVGTTSTGSAGSGNAHNNMQPSAVMKMCIKT